MAERNVRGGCRTVHLPPGSTSGLADDVRRMSQASQMKGKGGGRLFTTGSRQVEDERTHDH